MSCINTFECTINWHKINYGQKLCAESYLILTRKLIRIYFKEKVIFYERNKYEQTTIHRL